MATRKTSNSQDQPKFTLGVRIPPSIDGSNMPISAQNVDNKDITEPADSLPQL